MALMEADIDISITITSKCKGFFHLPNKQAYKPPDKIRLDYIGVAIPLRAR